MELPRILENVIANSFEDAAAFHGHLGLTAGAWRARITRILARCHKSGNDTALANFVERLHNRDLYLASACAEGHDAAWRRFESLYQRYIRELVQCVGRNALQALDVGEELLVDLFLPDRSGQSRIGSYDGRSSLATWLHVIVTHRIANERVRKWNTVERPGDMPDVADTAAVGFVETDVYTERFDRAIERSLRDACRTLTFREGQLLIWRYEAGLMLDEIGRLTSMHPSTVCRQLERLQGRVRAHVIRILEQAYGYPAAVIDECVNHVLENRSQSVSLFRVIAESLPRANDSTAPPVAQAQIA